MDDHTSIRLLAVEQSADGSTTLHLVVRTDGVLQTGTATPLQGADWAFADRVLPLGSVHDVIELAPTPLTDALPHWPSEVTDILARRGLRGAGTIAVDAEWFLNTLSTSPLEHPLVLLDATSALGLTGLHEASQLLADLAAEASPGDRGLLDVLTHTLEAEQRQRRAPDWGGEGRLIGEHVSGDLVQLGEDVADGCLSALGQGPLEVRYSDTLGLALAPLIPKRVCANRVHAHEPDGVGLGLEVGQVDADSLSADAGVLPGMVIRHIEERETDGEDSRSLLAHLDEALEATAPLTLRFATAAPVSKLYAVEMPAREMLTALAKAHDRPPPAIEVGAAMDAHCGSTLLWREDTPKLFLGAAGSVTCAHTDICPQLQLAHGLLGLKILGVASHGATPRLRADHGGDGRQIDADATYLPTDRPLTEQQRLLLTDEALSLVLLRPGDLAVFDSGALHCASNGADQMSCALYHGVMTPAAVPRLRAAAKDEVVRDDDYGEHLFAADLLAIVEADR